MTILDKFIRYLRTREVLPFILGKQIRVLDIGCNDGYLLDNIKDTVTFGYGVDLSIPETRINNSHNILLEQKDFMEIQGKFDVVTMLAVIEHFNNDLLKKVPTKLHDILNAHGLVAITMPSPVVDKILDILTFFKLVDHDELDADGHHGLEVLQVKDVFLNNGFRLVCDKKFEFKLNNLLVFEKI